MYDQFRVGITQPLISSVTFANVRPAKAALPSPDKGGGGNGDTLHGSQQSS